MFEHVVMVGRSQTSFNITTNNVTGKHDVSSLSHISRHSSSAGFTPRGVSFRGSTSRRT